MHPGNYVGETLDHFKGVLNMKAGYLKVAPITLLLILAIGFLPDSSLQAQAQDDCKKSDCRDTLAATFYAGVGIDTFAAGELNRYLNQEESGKKRERFVAGFDFGYRIFGSPSEKTLPWEPQIWVYGETVHGVRSADFDCAENPNLEVCKPFDLTSAGTRTLFILRNASSLEGFAGLRYEFLELQGKSPFAANAYFKTQYGFLTVSRNAGDVVDLHQYAALGAIVKKGKFMDSYLEVGFGRTDLFGFKSKDRWKADGMFTWEIDNVPLLGSVYPFVQITVDADFGGGSDSVQSYIGLAFDIDKLFGLGGSQ
jgi:hypothetical protein